MNKKITPMVVAILLLAGCNQSPKKENLSKNCNNEQEAIIAAEYYLYNRFGSEVLKKRPYIAELDEGGEFWNVYSEGPEKIANTDVYIIGGGYSARIGKTNCEPLSVMGEE